MTTPLTSPYSTADDLLVEEAGLILGDTFDKDKFVRVAADDMDAKLGFIYRLPLTPDIALLDDFGNPIQVMPINEVLLLKSINNKLASGRLFMNLLGSANGDRLHAYGWNLVQEADNMLNMLANGEIVLSALRRAALTQVVPDGTRGPSVTNFDDVSLVSAFEEQVFRNRPRQVYPGGPFITHPGNT